MQKVRSHPSIQPSGDTIIVVIVTTAADADLLWLVPIAVGLFCGWLASVVFGGKRKNPDIATDREKNIFASVAIVVSAILIWLALDALK